MGGSIWSRNRLKWSRRRAVGSWLSSAKVAEADKAAFRLSSTSSRCTRSELEGCARSSISATEPTLAKPLGCRSSDVGGGPRDHHAHVPRVEQRRHGGAGRRV